VVLRVAFFVLMALALVGFGTVAWLTMRPPPPPQVAAAVQVGPEAQPAAPAAPSQPQVKVLVAARTVAAGSMLKPEDIVAREVAVGSMPGAISAESADAVRAIVGSMAKHAMAAGEAVRDDDVIKPTDHGFMAAALQPGMRAVTIGVDATSGSAGLVWPGDRVDLTLTQTLTDPALPPGRRVSAETILTNARVIAIDQQLVHGGSTAGGDGQARTVTLEVNPADVQRVSVAMRLGRLSLSVRAVSGEDTNNTASPRGGSVYARDVSSALGGEAPAPGPKQTTIHVFHGSSDPKEFKY